MVLRIGGNDGASMPLLASPKLIDDACKQKTGASIINRIALLEGNGKMWRSTPELNTPLPVDNQEDSTNDS